MEKREIIEKVKEMIFGVKNHFADANTQNGALLRVEGPMFAVGSPIFKVEGEEVNPLEDGEFVLESGVTLKVKEGVIDEIIPVETDETVETEEMEEEVKEEMEEEVKEEMQEEVKEEIEDEEDEIAILKEIINELENKIKFIQEESVSKEDFNRLQEATIFLTEEFSNLPDGEKVNLKPSGFESNSKPITKQEKVNDLIKYMRNKK